MLGRILTKWLLFVTGLLTSHLLGRALDAQIGDRIEGAAFIPSAAEFLISLILILLVPTIFAFIAKLRVRFMRQVGISFLGIISGIILSAVGIVFDPLGIIVWFDTTMSEGELNWVITFLALCQVLFWFLPYFHDLVYDLLKSISRGILGAFRISLKILIKNAGNN